MDFPELVVHQFGDVAIAVLANPAGFADCIEYWLNGGNTLVCAPDKHNHVATDGRIERAGHGRIDCHAAGRTEFSPQCSHERGVAGSQIDPRFARTLCGEEAIFAAHNGFDFTRTKHHADDHGAGLQGLSRRVGFLCALRHESIDRAFPYIVGDHRKACAQEVPCER